jgi:hypothetical protein
MVLLVMGSGQAPSRSLLVLPFGLGNDAFNPKDFKSEEFLTREFLPYVKGDERLQVIVYSRTHPTVRRAVAERALPSAVFWAPYTEKVQGVYKAVSLGKLFRCDFSVAGVVEQWSYDKEKKIARVLVLATVFDVKEEKIRGTIAITAEASGDSEVSALSSALKNWAEQAGPQVVRLTLPPASPPQGGI